VRSFRVADVLDLAEAQSDTAEDHLRKVFEWEFERTMTSVRLLFGASGSIVVALLAALLREKSDLSTAQIVAILASAAVLGGVGSLILWRARTLHRDFLAALQLHSVVKDLGPLLARYRAERR
jgi:hypothetical protein